MHLLSGQPAIETALPGRSVGAAPQEIEELRARVTALEGEVVELRSLLLDKAGE